MPWLSAVLTFAVVCPHAWSAEFAAAKQFRNDVQPILKEYCYDCHADGANKGGVSFDEFKSDAAMLENHELWLKALKNVRANIMPPPKKSQPSADQKRRLEQWIKTAVFQSDPQNPDPGRVTVRRLNRVEYRNTVRDLLGVDFDTEKEFPPDDAGHGFDNIGDVLTLPPMLLEKYLAAAKTVVTKAVPSVPGVAAEQVLAGRSFSGEIGAVSRTNRNPTAANALTLSYYEQASVSNRVKIEQAGRYQLLLDFAANERFVDNQFDYNKCRLVLKADGKELHSKEYTREGSKAFHYEFDQDWKTGEHELVIEVHPLTPDQRQVRSLTLRIDSVTVRGPMDQKYWVRPKNYEKFFPRDTPNSASARREYAREILEPFVQKAYRRPVDARTVERLVSLAESTYQEKGKEFEQGISQAMVAVLASPRFLFREESAEQSSGKTHPLVDEYALASRLSYFFWSSMPDDELFRIAGEKKLRAHLAEQTKRMLADRKSEAFVRNFVGQWLQTRDIETVTIDARQVLNRERVETPVAAPAVDLDRERRMARFRELRAMEETNHLVMTAAQKKELQEVHDGLFGPGAPVVSETNAVAQTNQFARNQFGQRGGTNRNRGFRGQFRGPRTELTGDLRRAMRQETEMAFDYVLRKDRSLLELLDSDYTFLNERLARHYGLTNLNVTGDEMVLVKLPPESPRGGVITHGSVLAVTSNPTRTSPVKRGLFVLDNLLGTPPPPPPPDIPPLEDAAKAMKEKTLTLRETLALHREQPLCSSCHNRMDPLGLALDNFNAMGMWRDQERGTPIDATGKLLSGESFSNVKELKKILATNHATEFYHTITEKLLTYALGRGLEYYDVPTVDAIVERLQKSNGRPSELVAGIIESAPFQKTRGFNPAENVKPTEPTTQRADARIKP
ncbi:MAG TPA: DUF1592 domain-containing protein [Methylomirabilota bacterium]|nr:DUF1592 domain-containing protein [Methylomirabilota bacterium]